jgi:hypothetical protein
MVGERVAVWPFRLFPSRWRLGTPTDRAGCLDVGGVRDGCSSRSGSTNIDFLVFSFGISPRLQDLHEEASWVNVKLIKLV